MKRAFLAAGLLLAAFAAAAAQEGPPKSEPAAPYKPAPDRPLEYAGPGRDEPPPGNLEEILLGWFGPADPNHPSGGDLWMAASLAVEEADRAGGRRGIPYRLVPAWAENPWKGGVSQLAHLAFYEKVWAILGGIDGPTTHLAEQIVVKALLPLVNPAGMDRTINMASVPWVFSVPPADDSAAAVLAAPLEERLRGGSSIMLSANDHDSHLLAARIQEILQKRGVGPGIQIEFAAGTTGVSGLTEKIVARSATTLVVIGDAADSARVVLEARAARPEIAIFGGPAMGRRFFLEKAGREAEGAVLPLACDPAFSASPFAASFTAKVGRPPDCAAAMAYDAAKILLAAIEKAGPNRALIRDALRDLSPWAGVSGPIAWNNVGQNTRPFRPAVVHDGIVVPLAGSLP